jgi:hypothetical protein
MHEISINSYFGNPTSHSDLFLTEKSDEILLLIACRGVCFTTEIARDTGINIEEVNKILAMFKRHKFVNKLYPSMEEPQPQFRGRLIELQAMGISSYEKIRNFSWWTLEVGGFEFLKKKYQGEHKPISGGIVKALKLVILEEEPSKIDKSSFNLNELNELMSPVEMEVDRR